MLIRYSHDSGVPSGYLRVCLRNIVEIIERPYSSGVSFVSYSYGVSKREMY